MNAEHVAQHIKQYNAHRIPALLLKKYKAMRSDIFAFFRAIAHVVYHDIPSDSFLYNAPPVWICGDLHLENYGSYKGDNRIAYFNITDFDECILASPLLDIIRMLGSIHVATQNLGISSNDAQQLCVVFVDTYFQTLEQGYIRALEGETARGIIKDFLEEVRARKRKAFLRKRTIQNNGKIQLCIDGEKTIALPLRKRKEILSAIHQWSAHRTDAGFFRVHDIALRAAGVSSLGLERYVVLIEGKGSPNGNYLLDIKETRPSCITPYTTIIQPKWKSEGQRVIEIQQRVQPNPPALLSSIAISAKNFVLREHQPTANTINYSMFRGKEKKLQKMVEDMARTYAWGNLQSSGRQGSAIADELIAFARQRATLKKYLLQYASASAHQIGIYYQAFSTAYDDGFYTKF